MATDDSHIYEQFCADEARNLREPHVLSPADKYLPPVWRGVAVLVVYCFHNAWNCWAGLTLSADAPSAEELLGITQAQVGLINTFGTMTVLVCLPAAMFCRWRRALLALGAFVNVVACPLRYLAATQQSLVLAIVAMALQGMAFAVIAVWPALIATLFFREERWALVIAVSGLSNYIGGALAALFIPRLTGNTSQGLLTVLEAEVIVAAVLALLSLCFLWIPETSGDEPISIWKEAQAFARPKVLSQVLVYGVALGLSVVLQMAVPMMLHDSGFTTNDAGAGNCMYQLAASVVGIGLGSLLTQRHQLRPVLAWIHRVMVLASGLLLGICVLVDSQGRSEATFYAMLIVLALLGASLMGMLPFTTQQMVYAAHPASENCATGALNLVCMLVSTIMNYICPALGGLPSVALVFGLVLAEALCFGALQRWWFRSPDAGAVVAVTKGC